MRGFYTSDRFLNKVVKLNSEKYSYPPQRLACRSLVLLLPYRFHSSQRVPSRAAFYLQMRGLPTGLEPATFGATIRRYLFPSIAGDCRTGLDKLITLLVVARRFRIHPLGEYIKVRQAGAPEVIWATSEEVSNRSPRSEL